MPAWKLCSILTPSEELLNIVVLVSVHILERICWQARGRIRGRAHRRAAIHILVLPQWIIKLKRWSVSKSAIRYPSANFDFACFASSLDLAGKLWNHFNNVKVRYAEYDKLFQRPFCPFCENFVVPKTRRGLWKSGMSKHWSLSHAAEFVDAQEYQDRQELVSQCPQMICSEADKRESDCSHSITIATRKARQWMATRIWIRWGRLGHLQGEHYTPVSEHGHRMKYI